jgi:hypothetical protein
VKGRHGLTALLAVAAALTPRWPVAHLAVALPLVPLALRTPRRPLAAAPVPWLRAVFGRIALATVAGLALTGAAVWATGHPAWRLAHAALADMLLPTLGAHGILMVVRRRTSDHGQAAYELKEAPPRR